MTQNDPLASQVGGSHYKGVALQPVEFATIAQLGFVEGNIVKYVVRWRNKNGKEDVQKVLHYAQILLHLAGKHALGRDISHRFPLISGRAPLSQFLAQYPDLTPGECKLITLVTNWRRIGTLGIRGRAFKELGNIVKLAQDLSDGVSQIDRA